MAPKLNDILCTQFLTDDSIRSILQLALYFKQHRHAPEALEQLRGKTFLMLFFNPSMRTRISFETALTELGGHAIYMTPEMGRFKFAGQEGENIEDTAKVMSRFAAGIGIRIEDKGQHYGAGHELLTEFAKHATVPVINMADDRFHPCQGLADIFGWAERLGGGAGQPDYNQLRGKKILFTWAKGKLHRSRTSVHESLLMASRFGLDITLARPDGYDLDPEVYQWVKANASKANSKFEIVNQPEIGYEKTDIVYSRNWISEQAYAEGQIAKAKEIHRAMALSDWMLTQEKMKRTNNAIFTHPMPVDRGYEVEDSIASSAQSVIYDVAENRLHVQKAILALSIGNKGKPNENNRATWRHESHIDLDLLPSN